MTRKALGRGLRALIPDPPEAVAGIDGEDSSQAAPHEAAHGLAEPATATATSRSLHPAPGRLEDVRSIPVDAIVPSTKQPRTEWDDAGLDQLKQSIMQSGLLEPIIVRPMGDRFELVAGERRWRACRAAGWKEIPALVRAMEDQRSLEAALTENLQREDLNPVEEARAYAMMSAEYGLTHEEVARRVAKDRSTVSNLMRLLRLPEVVLQHVSRGTLSVGHARVLLSLPEEQQIIAAEKFVREGWSVRDAEAWVTRMTGGSRRNGKARASRRGMQKPEHLRRIEEDLGRHFGTQTKLRVGRHGGKIEIRFHDDEELSRLLELFGLVVV